MVKSRKWMQGAACSMVLGAVLLGGKSSVAQPKTGRQAPASPATAAAVSDGSPENLVETREQLIALLRMSPTLANVVASDSSLLANQEYIARNNPELAKFLEAHPEVVRNPDFYLFADITASHGRRVEGLQRKLWPERFHDNDNPWRNTMEVLVPSLGFLVVLGALLWFIRTLIDNRRWGKIFKMQTEVHTRLIERFGTSAELLEYMGTDAGKRFLEAAPIPVDFDRDRRVPAVLSRVLISLQAGVVLTLLGAGLMALRHSLPWASAPLLVFGMVMLMPGLGLVISAAITWVVAGRLGLMPSKAEEVAEPGGRL